MADGVSHLCHTGIEKVARPAGLEPLLALAGPHPRSLSLGANAPRSGRRRSTLGAPLGSQAAWRAGRATFAWFASRSSRSVGNECPS
jgi:hypothetical protein